MDVYTAIPLIPSSSGSNTLRMERIQSRAAARSLLKVLVFLITLLAVLSVIILHAMHKQQNSSNTVYSFETILGDEKEISPTSRFVEEIPKSAQQQQQQQQPQNFAWESSTHGGLRGFPNGPAVHRVIMIHPARAMDIDSARQVFSEFERDVLQVFNAVEREMEETMNSHLVPFAAGFGSLNTIMDEFFKGPLSGFEEIHRPCAMVRDVSVQPAVLPVAEVEVEEEQQPMVEEEEDAIGKSDVSTADYDSEFENDSELL
jgi:hypothetical protein